MSDLPNDHPSDDVLHALLDGELDGRHQKRLAAHLHECASCAARMERLSRLFDLIESLPEAALESDFSAAVLRSLPAASRRLPRLAALEAALASALMIVAAAWLAAAGLSSEWALALQGWVDGAANEILGIASELPAQLYDLQRELQPATGTSPAPGLPAIPATQLWLLAGSAALLWAVGNGLLLRRSGEEGP